MFVPSLSWQKDRILFQNGQKVSFSHTRHDDSMDVDQVDVIGREQQQRQPRRALLPTACRLTVLRYNRRDATRCDMSTTDKNTGSLYLPLSLRWIYKVGEWTGQIFF